MLTGLEDTSSIERAYDEGATDFIPSRSTGRCCVTESVMCCAPQTCSMNWCAAGRARQRPAHRSHGKLGVAARRRPAAVLGHLPPRCSARMSRPSGMGTTRSSLASIRPIAACCARRSGGPPRSRLPVSSAASCVPTARSRTMREIAVPVFDSAGAVSSVQGTLQDITDRIEAERRIRYLAYFDSLTGLPNRQSFRETLDAMVLRAGRRSDTCAVMFSTWTASVASTRASARIARIRVAAHCRPPARLQPLRARHRAWWRKRRRCLRGTASAATNSPSCSRATSTRTR